MADRATWAKRVQRWVDSGLSASVFAREMGINPRTLTYWKWKLRSDSGQARSYRRKAAAPTVASFVEVALTPAVARMLEVDVRGVTVRVPDNFEEEALVRLVSALERRP